MLAHNGSQTGVYCQLPQLYCQGTTLSGSYACLLLAIRAVFQPPCVYILILINAVNEKPLKSNSILLLLSIYIFPYKSSKVLTS